MKHSKMYYYAANEDAARKYAGEVCHKEGYAGHGVPVRVDRQEMPRHIDGWDTFETIFYGCPGS